MKKMSLKLFANVLCTHLFFNGLSAVQVNSETIQMINESSQPFCNQEVVEDGLLRALFDEKNEEFRDQIAKNEHPLEIDEEQITNDFSSIISDYYSTSHREAYHKPYNVTVDGLNIEMDDKSIWRVHDWDAYKVKTWDPQDIIVICPNTNIFTKWSYPYKFINLDKNQIAKSKMILTPVLNDPQVDIHTHWIEEIDYRSRLIRLEDGSLWNIAWGDSNVMKSFSRYNIVIIGTNDGWFRSSEPNILICVKNNQYIRGIVIN